MKGTVDSTDLKKIRDILERNLKFHKRRDEMNAELHMAAETRYSPLTNETDAACDRILTMIVDIETEDPMDSREAPDCAVTMVTDTWCPPASHAPALKSKGLAGLPEGKRCPKCFRPELLWHYEPGGGYLVSCQHPACDWQQHDDGGWPDF